MSKGIGEKLLGLFIEEVGAPPSVEARKVTEEERVDEVPHPASTSIVTPQSAPAPVIVAPGAAHDAEAFERVYRRAGLPDPDRERLAKVVNLIASLPSEATIEVKRAIVGASLEAFGVPIDRVLGTGHAATAALETYVLDGQRRTQEVLAEGEKRIAKLNAEIEEVRRLMSLQVDAQQELVRATAVERARLDVAVEFFGRTVEGAASNVTRLRRVR